MSARCRGTMEKTRQMGSAGPRTDAHDAGSNPAIFTSFRCLFDNVFKETSFKSRLLPSKVLKHKAIHAPRTIHRTKFSNSYQTFGRLSGNVSRPCEVRQGL